LYCGGSPDTVEHLIPMFRGGTSFEGNLAPACRSCNASKANRLIMEWSGRPSVYVTWPSKASRPRRRKPKPEVERGCERCDGTFLTRNRYRRFCDSCRWRKVKAETVPCRFEGCDRPTSNVATGLCFTHYKRYRRGDELRPIRGWQRHSDAPYQRHPVVTKICLGCGDPFETQYTKYCTVECYLKTVTTNSPFCTIPGCDKPTRSKGWCNAHHSKYLTYGDPLGKPKSRSEKQACLAAPEDQSLREVTSVDAPMPLTLSR
jgi:hypothetical protein